MNNDLLQKETSRNYLLVEGSDDAHVFRSLLNHYQIIDRSSSDARRFKNTSTHFEIIPHEGIDNILRALRLEIIRGDVAYRRYGIVVDADEHLHITWQRFRSILDKSGYNEVPSVPRANGTTFRQAGLPTIGIWLMPDNTLPGMMEDFISFLRPPDDVFWPMAEDIVQKVIEKGCHFRPSYKSKACLHTWLAWQEEPGKPMGLAITKKYVNADSPHAQQLIIWIRQLFGLDSA